MPKPVTSVQAVQLYTNDNDDVVAVEVDVDDDDDDDVVVDVVDLDDIIMICAAVRFKRAMLQTA